MTLSYTAQADMYLNQAWEELNKGDLRQAAEKGWGAATQMIKAVGQKRGESHHHHREMLEIVNRLVQEKHDADLVNEFAAAQALHVAFYEGAVNSFTVNLQLTQVGSLVEKLRPMA